MSYRELNKYEGDFYTAYLRLNESLEKKVSIVANYNGGDKEGNSSLLCGNYKEYELAELLKVKAPKKRA